MHFIALRLMINHQDESVRAQAISLFNTFRQSTNYLERIKAARLLPYMQVESLEIYQRLIMDDHPSVAGNAIASAALTKKVELLPYISARVVKGGIAVRYRKNLIVFKDFIIPYIVKQMPMLSSKRFVEVKAAIAAISGIKSPMIESALIEIAEKANLLVKHYVIQYLSYRAEKTQSTANTIQYIKENLLFDISYIATLDQLQSTSENESLKSEIIARRTLAKERILFSLTIVHRNFEIFSLIPIILRGKQADKARAIEYLLSVIPTASSNQILEYIFTDNSFNAKILSIQELKDKHLAHIISVSHNVQDEATMDELQKLYFLRKVTLFENLSAEALLTIADEFSVEEKKTGETIFTRGDFPRGIYVVLSGEVNETLNDDTITTHDKYAVFGEVPLLANEVYQTKAFAKSHCILLFLSKESFDKITEDMPEVLRGTVQWLIKYFKNP